MHDNYATHVINFDSCIRSMERAALREEPDTITSQGVVEAGVESAAASASEEDVRLEGLGSGGSPRRPKDQ